MNGRDEESQFFETVDVHTFDLAYSHSKDKNKIPSCPTYYSRSSSCQVVEEDPDSMSLKYHRLTVVKKMHSGNTQKRKRQQVVQRL